MASYEGIEYTKRKYAFCGVMGWTQTCVQYNVAM